MADPLLYDDSGYFVVLEADGPEQIVTVGELRDRLAAAIAQLGDELPRDLQKFETTEERVQSLIDTSCELDLGPDRLLQWYAVRLERPDAG